jgi:1-phosphofructokinase
MERNMCPMIYTLTCNPALDYIISVDQLQLGMTNRITTDQLVPGGKGINVSMMLHNLGIGSISLGFVGGFTGAEIRRRVEAYGSKTDFILLEQGNSRINVKLNNIEGTELNAIGPTIEVSELQQLYQQLAGLGKGDILVLAGSIPDSLPDSFYQDILMSLKGKGVEVIVDAAGQLLRNVLQYHPFLIKPNQHELGELFQVELSERDEVIPYAKQLQDAGARNVLVSMSGKGAVLLDETGKVYSLPAPKGTVQCAVGAGDSMVAGFLTGWLERGNYEHAFKMGVAAGSASAFSQGLGTREEVDEIYKTL